MYRILFFLMIMSLSLCYAQKNTDNQNEIETYIKGHNSEFEKLDTSIINHLSLLFRKDNEELPIQITFPFKGKNFIMQRSGRTHFIYEERDSLNNRVEKFDFDVSPTGGGIYYREKIDSLFNFGEMYYSNGNLRSKGISSWLGFGINKGYRYDEKGNLTETIDHDEGYEFDYEKVLAFCESNIMDILSKKEPSRNTVHKVTLENGKKVWVINYHNMESNKIDRYQLDGQTGEVIRKLLNQEIYGFKHY